MKRTIQLIAIAAFAISFTFTSCSKDETTPAVTGPTISLIDSTGTGIVDTTNFFTSTWMTLKVTPSAGSTIASLKLDVKIDGVMYAPGSFDAVDVTQKDGFSESGPIDFIVSILKIPFGKKMTLAHLQQFDEEGIKRIINQFNPSKLDLKFAQYKNYIWSECKMNDCLNNEIRTFSSKKSIDNAASARSVCLIRMVK